jgi:hypothetical protein
MIRIVKTVELNFDGYYGETGLPPSDHDCAGIYAVYAGQHTPEGKCKLRELLYIGRSVDAAKRPSPSHHKYEDWRSRLGKGEFLYFSFADTDDEERAEAALIYKIKPVCNDTGKDSFSYPETNIRISGANAGLGYFFTVRKTG